MPEDDEKDELEAPEKAPAPEPAPVPVPDPDGCLLMSLGWRKIEPVSNGSKNMSSAIDKYILNVITNVILYITFADHSNWCAVKSVQIEMGFNNPIQRFCLT